MPSQPRQDKWSEIKAQFDKNERLETEADPSPVDTAAEIKRHILNNLGPVDTVEEVDAQRNNQGPKDTKIETVERNEELDPTAPRPGG
ncbi:hypothetical protein [Legionella hackeliae]|uniref:Uncharacterized protein n=1 Tax=Legionella hackeliae TaxID=449 RepID=A0A0A8US67_LEGHA|nr:hypothetical protein [Legionella hackeliae]KTD14167.1 hypothetical protein Lhac_0479 [Legionella hackeliae]CEK10376.1 conserved protein of unknown function [Legionella hackeliae]STX47111.1 Uncharacterised protein [Legionella hackeliae]